jgi:hypothetical protein
MSARSEIRSCKSRAMLVLHPRAKAGTLSPRNHFRTKPSPRRFPQTAHERPLPRPQLLSFLIHSGDSKGVRNTLNRLTFKSLRFHIHAHSFPASPMFSVCSPKQRGVCTPQIIGPLPAPPPATARFRPVSSFRVQAVFVPLWTPMITGARGTHDTASHLVAIPESR